MTMLMSCGMVLQCVICMSAKATMQTQPCGHRVVCRLCFVKTIQTAVAQRVLPLRCVVCRTKILKLKQSPPPPSSSSTTTPARSRGFTQVRATRHGGSTTGSGITTALSPRHSATGGSKLMQPLPIYPAVNNGSSGVRGGTSGSSSNSCHHHHLPLHHQAVQRRAMTAWTSAVTPPLTGPDRGGSLARLGATDTAFNTAGVISTGGRPARRPTGTSSSTAGHVDSPRISTTAPASRVPITGHDSKRIQRLK